MKALTLTQPWATLVAIGAKRYETRGWSTPHRGPLAIHAAKGVGAIGGEAGLQMICRSEPFQTALVDAGFAFASELPRGAIVASAELYSVHDSVEIGDALRWALETDNDFVDQAQRADAALELAFGDYSPSRFAWILEDVRRLSEPIECRGALGLWDVPPDLLPLVESRAREPEAVQTNRETVS